MSSLIEEKDRALFRKITKDSEHVLYDLLPEMKHRTLRTQNHNYILPQIKTERFKRCFINRYLFKYELSYFFSFVILANILNSYKSCKYILDQLTIIIAVKSHVCCVYNFNKDYYYYYIILIKKVFN